MALAKDPTLLILDEPTTGLDATVEAEVLDLVVRAARGVPVERAVHQPQPRRDRAHVRPRRRALRRAARRAGRRRRRLQQPAPSVHGGPAALHPARRRDQGQGKLDTIPGFLPGLGAELPGCVYADRCGLVQDDLPPRRSPTAARPGGGHGSRCHFHEKAQEVPRDTEPVAGQDGAARRRRDADPEHRATCARRSTRTATRSARWRTSRSRSAPARRSGSSASPAAARRRSRACCSGSPSPTRARWSSSTAPRSPAASTSATASRSRAVQIVFQNPDSALNRRFSIQRIIGRAVTMLSATRATRRSRACATSRTRCASTCG